MGQLGTISTTEEKFINCQDLDMNVWEGPLMGIEEACNFGMKTLPPIHHSQFKEEKDLIDRLEELLTSGNKVSVFVNIHHPPLTNKIASLLCDKPGVESFMVTKGLQRTFSKKNENGDHNIVQLAFPCYYDMRNVTHIVEYRPSFLDKPEHAGENTIIT